MILVRTGVIEMGLKSACCVGTATLETGRIQACFHCRGTTEVARERLKRWDRGWQNMGAPVLRNHEGRPSNPVAVGRRVSKIPNILYSSMYFLSEVLAVSFSIGAT